MKKCAKFFVFLISVFIFITALSSCNNSEEAQTDNSILDISIPDENFGSSRNTLNVGSSEFSGRFNPFYAVLESDLNIIELTSVPLLTFDNEGKIVNNAIKGETVYADGKEYTYNGIADINVTTNIDDSEIYDITLREDVLFSDGKALTADDVIFSMYVLCDPDYDGPSIFSTLPIVGMDDYRDIYDHLYEIILNEVYFNNDSDNTGNLYTQEQVDLCINAFQESGLEYINDTVEYYKNKFADYGVKDVSTVAALLGYTLDADATESDFWNVILDACSDDINTLFEEEIPVSFEKIFKSKLGSRENEFYSNVIKESKKDYIEGIEKTGEFSLRITLSESDADAFTKLSIRVAPLHYYGDTSNYDYDNHIFGFAKRNLDNLKSNNTPVGAGPYIFESHTDGKVSLVKNESYYKRSPNIEYLNFIECDETDKLDGLLTGKYDIVDTLLSTDVKDKICSANYGEMSGAVVTTYTNNDYGYGYVGISAENVKICDDKASQQSKSLRKAFATLFAIYRNASLEEYFDGYEPLEYPVSNMSWIYPSSLDTDFHKVYSFDVDGNSIYTEDMTTEQKYSAAISAAIEYFKHAGYIYDDNTCRFISAPNSARLCYNIVICSDGNNDHPMFKLISNIKSVLGNMGIELSIINITDAKDFQQHLLNGECDMWVSGWKIDTQEPPLHQLYHSDSDNIYGIADESLDRLIDSAVADNEQSYRKKLYKECFEKVFDWAVEIPVYPNTHATLVATDRVKVNEFVDRFGDFDWIKNVYALELV